MEITAWDLEAVKKSQLQELNLLVKINKKVNRVRKNYYLNI